jgi:hypothetical protein
MYPDAVFDENVTMASAATDPEHFVWLGCAPDHYHGGVEGAGVQWLVNSNGTLNAMIQVSLTYAHIDGIEFVGDPKYPMIAPLAGASIGTAGFKVIYSASGGGVTNCMFHGIHSFGTETPGWRQVAGISTNASTGVAGAIAQSPNGNVEQISPEWVGTGIDTSDGVAHGWLSIAGAVAASGTAPSIKNGGAAIATSTNGAAGYTNEITMPTGDSAPAAGDIIVLMVGNDSSSANQEFGAWSVQQGFNFCGWHGNTITDTHLAVYMKESDGTEDATIYIHSDSSQDHVAFLAVIEDAQLSLSPFNPVDAATAAVHTIAAETTPVNNCYALAFMLKDRADVSLTMTTAAPWTEIAEQKSGGTSGGCTLSVAEQTVATASSSGTCVVTTNISDGGVQGMVVLQPATTKANFKDEDDIELNTALATSSITATKPTGGGAPSVGDLLLIFVGNDSTGVGPEFDDVTYKPTGFTLIGTAGTSTVDCYIGIFGRIADGTETATIACPALSSADMWCAYAVVENFDNTTGLTTAIDSSTFTTDSSKPWNTFTHTPTRTNCLQIAGVTSDGGHHAPLWCGDVGLADPYITAILSRYGVYMNNLIYDIKYDSVLDAPLTYGYAFYDNTSNSTSMTRAILYNTIAKVGNGIWCNVLNDHGCIANNLYFSSASRWPGSAGVNWAGADFHEGNVSNCEFDEFDWKLRTAANTFTDFANDDYTIKKDHYIGVASYPQPFQRTYSEAAQISDSNTWINQPRWLAYTYQDITGTGKRWLDPTWDNVPGAFAYQLASDEARVTKNQIASSGGDYTSVSAWEAGLVTDPDPDLNSESDRGEVYWGQCAAESFDDSVTIDVATPSQHSSNFRLQGLGVHGGEPDAGARLNPTSSAIPVQAKAFASIYNMSLGSHYVSTARSAATSTEANLWFNCVFHTNVAYTPVTVPHANTVTVSGFEGATAFVGCGAQASYDSTLSGLELGIWSVGTSRWVHWLYCSANGVSIQDATPTGVSETVGWNSTASADIDSGNCTFHMCLMNADDSDAEITNKFTLDNQPKSFQSANAWYCHSGGALADLPQRYWESYYGVADTGIMFDEGDIAQSNNLDGDGANIGDVGNQCLLDWDSYHDSKYLLTLWSLLIYDWHGTARKNTPGAHEAGDPSAHVLAADSVTNNAVSLAHTGVPTTIVEQYTDVVEAVGGYGSPFLQDTRTRETPYDIIGLEERVDWKARLRYKNFYNFLSLWSADAFFTTVGILPERPRLGEPGLFSRSSVGYVVDRKGVLQDTQKSLPRMNWALVRGVWRRALLLEDGTINKVYRNTGFDDDLTTGWAKSGDAAATLTVVDDTDKIRDVGLLPWVTDGKVLKLDNSGGATNAQAQNNGTVGNLNKHSVSAFIRGDAGVIAIEGSGAIFAASTTYRRVRYENVTPSATSDNFVIDVAAGDVVYFILAQMEEAGWASTPVVNEASAATASRLPEELSYELPNNVADPGEVTVYMRFIAQMDNAAGVERTLFEISNRQGDSPWLRLYISSLGAYSVSRHNGTSENTAAIPSGTFSTSRGDEVEVVWTGRSDGTGRIIAGKNYADPAGSEFSVLAPAAAYSGGRFYLGSHPSGGNGSIALVDIKLFDREVLGTDADILDFCRLTGYKKAK